MSGSSSARRLRFLSYLTAGIATLSLGTAGIARAGDTDGYGRSTVNVPSVPITCTYSGGALLHPLGGGPPFANPNTTSFSFDISWIAQARGEYLLADRSHGRPSYDTEGGLLSNATSGDLLLINTDDPGAGAISILPPRNDPFAGHRCDENGSFGGLGSRNEIEGPNGVFTVNDTEAWVGDGPSYFTPGQTNSATDYKNDPCDSSVRVFSLITRRQIDHIDVHGCFRTDEGAFDAVDQIALFANPSEQSSVRAINPRARNVDNSPFITLISTVPGDGDRDRDHRWGDDDHRGGHHEILKQINFDGTNGTVLASGGIEQAVYSRQTGLFYIAVPANASSGTGADGWVVAVDPRPGHLGDVTNYPLASGTCPGGPAGAALGPNHELLLGCGGASPTGGEVVVDITNLGAAPTILSDSSQSCDEVAYDAGSDHFGGACNFTGAASPGIFAALINDARSKQFDLQIPTSAASGAHSIAADSVNEQFWMPKIGGDCGSASQACVAVYSPTASDDFGDPPPSP
jgi:hypothetical protein